MNCDSILEGGTSEFLQENLEPWSRRRLKLVRFWSQCPVYDLHSNWAVSMASRCCQVRTMFHVGPKKGRRRKSKMVSKMCACSSWDMCVPTKCVRNVYPDCAEAAECVLPLGVHQCLPKICLVLTVQKWWVSEECIYEYILYIQRVSVCVWSFCHKCLHT